ncbi:hypothetical protein BDD12DRAFT_815035 [Trichophaea hybrida]|nr:hypothetical protein BDD12DRAFT_815035 [Trichophaea hybrida]
MSPPYEWSHSCVSFTFPVPNHSSSSAILASTSLARTRFLSATRSSGLSTSKTAWIFFPTFSNHWRTSLRRSSYPSVKPSSNTSDGLARLLWSAVTEVDDRVRGLLGRRRLSHFLPRLEIALCQLHRDAVGCGIDVRDGFGFVGRGAEIGRGDRDVRLGSRRLLLQLLVAFPSTPRSAAVAEIAIVFHGRSTGRPGGYCHGMVMVTVVRLTSKCLSRISISLTCAGTNAQIECRSCNFSFTNIHHCRFTKPWNGCGYHPEM